ncbi:hypothetical protein GO491_01165 [Flavobacteriaceae bacterium Ap0902]|nr:hypothetical protein [Flavobacteriaceae bacterium Ap0902]
MNHAVHAFVEGGPGDPPKKRKITQKNSWDLNGDGKLQKIEGDLWGMNGGGDITVDGNLIDLGELSIEDLTFEKGTNRYLLKTVDAFTVLPYETASTYGGGYFKLINGKFQMQSSEYDYMYRLNLNFRDIGRDIINFIGDPNIYFNLLRPRPYGIPRASMFKSFNVNIKY